MSGESQKGYLENILDKILDYHSRQAGEPHDAMLLLGLVDLFGIVSVMNKQAEYSPGAAPMARQGGMDPMLSSLLATLLAQRMQGAPENDPGNPAGGGINPALLMSLMGNQVQRPEQAMLLNLLMGMMNNPRPGNNHPYPAAGPDKAVRPNTPEREKPAMAWEAGPTGSDNRKVKSHRPLDQANKSKPPPDIEMKTGEDEAGEIVDIMPDTGESPPKNGGVIIWDKRLG